jgi:hypothetical protein
MNGNNMDNAGCEASGTFMTTKTKYKKDQINELKTSSKNKNIPGIK